MRKILVIQLARFGDLLQSKRLLLSVAEQGRAEVHLCLDRSLVPLARLIYPDIVLHGVSAHAGQGQSPGEFLGANRKVFRELRQCGFETIYNVNFSGLNFAVAALFEPSRVRGYRWDRGQVLKDLWMDMAFRWTARRKPNPINLADFWAFLAEHPVAPETVNPAAEPKGGGVGVVMAGRDARRSLPPEVLARCVGAVADARGAKRIVFLGGPEERPLAAAVKKHTSRRVLARVENLVGKTGWADLLEVVSGLDVLLTPDTGTMHLAAHAGTPVLGFFLSSAWAFETGPYGLGHTVWQSTLDCAPCVEARPCSNELRCLAPFASNEFLRCLAKGGGADAPAHLAGFGTAFDELGLCFEAFSGRDPYARERRALRLLLGEYLGLASMRKEAGAFSARENELAGALYVETDWVLEQPRTF